MSRLITVGQLPETEKHDLKKSCICNSVLDCKKHSDTSTQKKYSEK